MKHEGFARAAAVSAALAATSLLAGCVLPGAQALKVNPVKCYTYAKSVLLEAADAPRAATRAHAIEALAGTLGKEAGAVFVQALQDDNPAVRFAAALAIGDTKYKPALRRLLKMAADKKTEPDKRVFAVVIYALYALGNDEYAPRLAELLTDREREVRMDAALAMGRMGEPSAIGPLKAILSNEQDDAVKLQLLESLARLGDTRSAEILEAYTKGYFLDLRLAAIPALGRSGGPRVARALSDLLEERHPVRVRVSAARELARLGQTSQEAYDLCVRALEHPQRVLDESNLRSRRAADTDAASLRCLAALALGWMGRVEAVNILQPLLKSTDGALRVAAAESILRLLAEYRPTAATAKKPAAAASRPASRPAAGEARPRLHTAGGKD
ncbi:MAG: HEAT repeat domain-containing protein [Planctomycetes bacterium]|nr:HEAT repeat domain-containing protein [Planctomycetota bacterium]